ncbi:hypothetical protein BGX26_002013 [Mortierella sp. AD094]|nr:hypothetical protein BGX26_002013 [Mortierella sp. AD094]
MARLFTKKLIIFVAAFLIVLAVLEVDRAQAVPIPDLAGDIKPFMQMTKPTMVAIKKGCKAAATNVKAAVQNMGAACQQMANAGAKIAGDATVGCGKTMADAPKRFYQLIKQLEKKGMTATVLKLIFGPPEKEKKTKKEKKKAKGHGSGSGSDSD